MSERVIAVVDYGAGNTQSVMNALEAVLPSGADATLTSDPKQIRSAAGVIVPGVGAARDTISNLERAGLVEPLLDIIQHNVPYLGICMGMQALMSYSEEDGRQPCLDVIPGVVRRFETDLPVPHMGWNTVRFTTTVRGHPLLSGIPNDSYFYFVHSYYCVPTEAGCIMAETDYPTPFASMLGRGNIMCTQFHPEKSGRLGLQLIANFVALAQAGGVDALAGAVRAPR